MGERNNRWQPRDASVAMSSVPPRDRRPFRVALLCDSADEGWSSMDVTSGCLAEASRELGGGEFVFTILKPPIRNRFRRFAKCPSWRAFTADRLIHRFYDYPRMVRRMRDGFDLFHIMDHSHAHLAHELPAEQTVITCHDLDTFGSILRPRQCRRSPLFRAMTARIWSGFQRAGRIICVSQATGAEVLAAGVVGSERVAVIPNGIQSLSRETWKTDSATALESYLGPIDPDTAELLHVGNNVPRKRIDVLVRILAAVRTQGIAARLIRVGEDFNESQLALIESLSLGPYIKVLQRVDAGILGAIYQRAALLLQTSDAEGFGLPVVESMASGTPVVASDIPALREVGGEITAYCPVADVKSWALVVAALLRERNQEPSQWDQRRARGVVWASRFSWQRAAEKTLSIYREILYRDDLQHATADHAML